MGNPPTKKTTLKLENVLGFAFSHLNGEGPYRGSATEVFGVMGFWLKSQPNAALRLEMGLSVEVDWPNIILQAERAVSKKKVFYLKVLFKSFNFLHETKVKVLVP